ncbi:MAG: phospholipase D-like domain-containing protein [Anaerolineae bacterium]|nr:phospholipase D-like domain-containing protein [Anaerolineae bacterium]
MCTTWRWQRLRPAVAALALVISVVLAGSTTQAASPSSPRTVFLPLAASHHPVWRISALYYDGLMTDEPDEAVQLWNVSNHAASLAGYTLSDGRRTAAFPALTAPAGAGLWCAYSAEAFWTVFGFKPACEWGVDSDPTVPNLTGGVLRFANAGSQALLQRAAPLTLVDALVYEQGNVNQPGWSGPSVQPYAPTTAFPAEGQVLYRKPDWATGRPIADTDTAADWAQDPADHITGRRVQYPGWNLEEFGRPPLIVASGTFTVALAPDNIFDLVNAVLASAQRSIRLSSYTFEHVALAQTLANRAARGVQVVVLLEGSPVGGITHQERYCAQLIEAAGGHVWFMVSDRNDATHERYEHLHAKYAVVDRRLLLISSENFTPDAMPDDDKSDGTAGRRGAAIVTDAAPLVAHALALFRDDLDPANHRDLVRWTASDPKYGAPPAGFVPSTQSGGTFYNPVIAQPATVFGDLTAQFVQAPEAALAPPAYGGLLGMVAMAGPGDTVLVEQLYEREHWGRSTDTPQTAPNPRLNAYLDAARRGARVRILLDAFFDTGGNATTVAYLSQVARAEGLDLEVRLGNPTGSGIHNKMVLVQAGGRGWLHVGSLNGSEASAKRNRELAIQLQSNPLTDYLAAAFWRDWLAAGGNP